MNEQESPYVCHCGFCEQGLLRLMRCQHCGIVAAVCDECELVWVDLALVSAEPTSPSSSSFPACPACKTEREWQRLTEAAIADADLVRFRHDVSG